MGKWNEHHEMSRQEIANEIGCSERAVQQALKRAMKKLRDGRAIIIRDLHEAREKEQAEKYRNNRIGTSEW